MITQGEHTYISGIPQERFKPEVQIGAYCSIGAGVVFYGGGEHPPVMNPQTVSSFPFHEKWQADYTPCGSRGKITIGNDVWIGEDARILDGTVIGDGCIIGCMSVVSGLYLPYSVIVGSPAKVVKYRFDPEQIKALKKIQWWDWPEDKIKSEIPYMKDIEKFIKRNYE